MTTYHAYSSLPSGPNVASLFCLCLLLVLHTATNVNPGGWGSRPPDFGLGVMDGSGKILYRILDWKYVGKWFFCGQIWQECRCTWKFLW